MNKDDFVAKQRQRLLMRRESKMNILEAGGEQAFSHSYNDISRIDFALQRMNNGQYGLCCNCGCMINEMRLTIIPETPFCAECASHIETR